MSNAGRVAAGVGVSLLVGGAFYLTGGALGLTGIGLRVVAGVGFAFGGGLASTLFGRPASTSALQAAKNVQIPAAGEGFPVKVVFGEVRITGVYMNHSASTFRRVAVKDKVPRGGKGRKKKVIVGYNYFYSWEYGLCAGPVDAVGQVFASPGGFELREDAVFTTFTDSQDFEDIDDIASAEPEGGTIRVWRGAVDQTRSGADDPYLANAMNYRDLCYAIFIGYFVGPRPYVRTHDFVVRRLPVVERDDATDLTTVGFVTRGSLDATHDNYWDANPAAIIYELLRNDWWGRGISSDLIDEPSFIHASQFYAYYNIGFSLTIDEESSLKDVLDGIRSHAGCLLLWDGEKAKLKVLFDTLFQYANIPTLTDVDIVAGSFRFVRPSWRNTINELRIEYTERAKRFRTAVHHVQDMANIETVGQINSERLTLPGIMTSALAQRMGLRILREKSYPLGHGEVQIDRRKAFLEPGDVFKIAWTEWTSTDATIFCRVLEIEDSEPGSELVRVKFQEDPHIHGKSSEDLTTGYDRPLPAFLDITPTADAAQDLFVPATHDFSAITVLKVLEPNIMLTGGVNAIIVLAQRPGATLTDLDIYWANDPWGQFQGDWADGSFVEDDVVRNDYIPSGETDTDYDMFRSRAAQSPGHTEPPFILNWEQITDYALLGSLTHMAVTGTLLTATGTQQADRGATGFRVALTDQSGDSATLLLATAVTAITDSLEDLVKDSVQLMVIGEEILAVGLAVETSAPSNDYTITNILRGLYGTEIVDHQVGAEFFYLASVDITEALEASEIPEGGQPDFKSYPRNDYGVGTIATPQKVYHAAAADQYFFRGDGTRPFAPEGISIASAGGGNYTVILRPRFIDKGAGFGSWQQNMDEQVEDIADYGFVFTVWDSGETSELTAQTQVAGTFAAGTGQVTLANIAASSTNKIRVYETYKGRMSRLYATFTVP